MESPGGSAGGARKREKLNLKLVVTNAGSVEVRILPPAPRAGVAQVGRGARVSISDSRSRLSIAAHRRIDRTGLRLSVAGSIPARAAHGLVVQRKNATTFIVTPFLKSAGVPHGAASRAPAGG